MSFKEGYLIAGLAALALVCSTVPTSAQGQCQGKGPQNGAPKGPMNFPQPGMQMPPIQRVNRMPPPPFPMQMPPFVQAPAGPVMNRTQPPQFLMQMPPVQVQLIAVPANPLMQPNLPVPNQAAQPQRPRLQTALLQKKLTNLQQIVTNIEKQLTVFREQPADAEPQEPLYRHSQLQLLSRLRQQLIAVEKHLSGLTQMQMSPEQEQQHTRLQEQLSGLHAQLADAKQLFSTDQQESIAK
jgi:hypothetical protein